MSDTFVVRVPLHQVKTNLSDFLPENAVVIDTSAGKSPAEVLVTYTVEEPEQSAEDFVREKTGLMDAEVNVVDEVEKPDRKELAERQAALLEAEDEGGVPAGDSLSDLDYRDLQDRAKAHGIKANQSADDLIEAIRAAENEN